MGIISTFNDSNDLPPVQNLSTIICSSIIETDPVKNAQDGYDNKVSQLSRLNSRTKSGRYMYFGLTTRYIRVTIDMGLLCMIEMSNAVVQEVEMEYPDVFNLSRRHWDR